MIGGLYHLDYQDIDYWATENPHHLKEHMCIEGCCNNVSINNDTAAFHDPHTRQPATVALTQNQYRRRREEQEKLLQRIEEFEYQERLRRQRMARPGYAVVRGIDGRLHSVPEEEHDTFHATSTSPRLVPQDTTKPTTSVASPPCVASVVSIDCDGDHHHLGSAQRPNLPSPTVPSVILPTRHE